MLRFRHRYIIGFFTYKQPFPFGTDVDVVYHNNNKGTYRLGDEAAYLRLIIVFFAAPIVEDGFRSATMAIISSIAINDKSRRSHSKLCFCLSAHTIHVRRFSNECVKMALPPAAAANAYVLALVIKRAGIGVRSVLSRYLPCFSYSAGMTVQLGIQRNGWCLML